MSKLLAKEKKEIETLKTQLEEQKSVDELYSKRLEEISDRILNVEKSLEKALYAQELNHLENGLVEAQRHRNILNESLGNTKASDVQPPRRIELQLTTIPRNRPTGRINQDTADIRNLGVTVTSSFVERSGSRSSSDSSQPSQSNGEVTTSR